MKKWQLCYSLWNQQQMQHKIYTCSAKYSIQTKNQPQMYGELIMIPE